MSELTPSESRKREKDIQSFDEHWYVDTKTSEIRHKPLERMAKFIDLFWRKRHRVSDLYWWTVRKWWSEDMAPFSKPIEHDSVPITGFPRKYQLQNGWTIPSEDLRYLFEGPLVDETGHEILVRHQSKFRTFVSLLSQLRPLSWIIVLGLGCVRYRQEILLLWNKLSNAI